MIALEAMMRLIGLADEVKRLGGRPNAEEQAQDETATAIIQRMLNTALPVSKYRCFVEIDTEQPRGNIKGLRKSPVVDEFTVCGTTVSSILGGLIGLSGTPVACRITLWEQRATGADMVSGFQGTTKSKRYRSWLEEIKLFDVKGTLQ